MPQQKPASTFDPSKPFTLGDGSMFDPSKPFTLGDGTTFQPPQQQPPPPPPQPVFGGGRGGGAGPIGAGGGPGAGPIGQSRTNPMAGLEPSDTAQGGDDWLTQGFGAFGNFLKNWYHTVSPLPLIKDYMTMSPQAFVQSYGQQAYLSHKDQFDKAKQAFQEGRTIEGMGHAGAAAIPLIGPIAGQAGEQIAAGDISGGLGTTAGLLTPFGAEKGAKVAGKVAGVAADVADAASRSQIRKVMTPTTGANKARFANQVRKIAGDVAREPGIGAMTREGMLEKVENKSLSINTKLDQVYQQLAESGDPKAVFSVDEVVRALEQKARDLGTQGRKVVGIEPDAGTIPVGKPLAFDAGTQLSSAPPVAEGAGSGIARPVVEPVDVNLYTRGDRLGSINRAIEDVRAHGDSIDVVNLRKMIQSWGEDAKAVYLPDISADALKNKSIGKGWADAERVGRDLIADRFPEIKPLNAQSHLLSTTREVMNAAEVADAARSGGHHKALAAGVGGYLGHLLGGGYSGAVAGGMVAIIIDSAMHSGLTTQIGVGRALARTADALRRGQTFAAEAGLRKAATTAGAKIDKGMWSDLTRFMTMPVGDAARTVLQGVRDSYRKRFSDDTGSVPGRTAAEVAAQEGERGGMAGTALSGLDRVKQDQAVDAAAAAGLRAHWEDRVRGSLVTPMGAQQGLTGEPAAIANRVARLMDVAIESNLHGRQLDKVTRVLDEFSELSKYPLNKLHVWEEMAAADLKRVIAENKGRAVAEGAEGAGGGIEVSPAVAARVAGESTISKGRIDTQRYQWIQKQLDNIFELGGEPNERGITELKRDLQVLAEKKFPYTNKPSLPGAIAYKQLTRPGEPLPKR